MLIGVKILMRVQIMYWELCLFNSLLYLAGARLAFLIMGKVIIGESRKIFQVHFNLAQLGMLLSPAILFATSRIVNMSLLRLSRGLVCYYVILYVMGKMRRHPRHICSTNLYHLSSGRWICSLLLIECY